MRPPGAPPPAAPPSCPRRHTSAWHHSSAITTSSVHGSGRPERTNHTSVRSTASAAAPIPAPHADNPTRRHSRKNRTHAARWQANPNTRPGSIPGPNTRYTTPSASGRATKIVAGVDPVSSGVSW